MPQHEIGRERVVQAVQGIESALPGRDLTGQRRAGEALDDGLARGQQAAQAAAGR